MELCPLSVICMMRFPKICKNLGSFLKLTTDCFKQAELNLTIWGMNHFFGHYLFIDKPKNECIK